MSVREGSFWAEMDRYHDLAETYERNIETVHPGSVTSSGVCACLDLYASYCSWAATAVNYREYRGPRVVNL